jgi:hypothetical protein
MIFDRDAAVPFTDEELSVMALEQIPGHLVAIDIYDVGNGKPLIGVGVGPELPPKLLNLVIAAPHMYQQLGREFQMLQSVIEFLETVNAGTQKTTGERLAFADELVATFTTMQNEIMKARRVAVVGPEMVAAEQRAETQRRY